MNQEERDQIHRDSDQRGQQRVLLESMQLQSNHPARETFFFHNECQDPHAVAQALEHNSTLTTLQLSRDVQLRPPSELMHFIKHTTTLKSLQVGTWLEEHFPDDWFVNELSKNTSIENLKCCSWLGRDVARVLKHLSKLKELKLCNLREVRSRDATQLAWAIKAHPNLVSLQFLPPASSTQQINSLRYLELDKGHASLRNLTLHHHMSISDFQYLGHVLKSPTCPLHQLAIRLEPPPGPRYDDIFNSFHPKESYDEMLDGLEANASLLSLDLIASVPIQVRQARRFQRFLAAETCSLRSLSLCDVQVLDGVTKVPIDSMVGPNALTNIILSKCLQSANLWRSLLNDSINTIECDCGDFDGLDQEFDSICQAIAGSATPMKRFVVNFSKPNSTALLAQIYDALRQSPSRLSSLCLQWNFGDDGILVVNSLCRLIENTTAQCEIESSSDDQIEHRQLKAPDRGLRILEFKGQELSNNMLKSLLHALTLNPSLQTLDIRHGWETEGEDHFPALILYLPIIKHLRKLMFSVEEKNVACSGADNLLKALEQNTSLTSVVIKGALAPYDAEQERAYRLKVKSICRRNWGISLSDVPSVVWLTPLCHALDTKNLNQAYALISNRVGIFDQVNVAGTKRKLYCPAHDGLAKIPIGS